jgi:hypothetical protein
MKEKLQNIQFLSTEEQKEIIGIFLKTCSSFFETFEQGIKKNDFKILKKICHNFGSSLIVFELENEMELLKITQKNLHKKDLINCKHSLADLEKNISKFNSLLQDELKKLTE